MPGKRERSTSVVRVKPPILVHSAVGCPPLLWMAVCTCASVNEPPTRLATQMLNVVSIAGACSVELFELFFFVAK